MAAFPGIQSCSDYGANLLADNQFNEEEKNKIKQEIDSLGQKFQILQKDINGEQDRSEMVQLASVIFFSFSVAALSSKKSLKSVNSNWWKE